MKNKAKHIELGNKGEELAIQFLKQRSYAVIDQNWRHEKLELDLVCRDENTLLVFLEVKTRQSKYYGNPEDAVSAKKAQNLLDAVEIYLEEKGLDEEFRFDVIAIVMQKDKNEVVHFKDAVSPF